MFGNLKFHRRERLVDLNHIPSLSIHPSHIHVIWRGSDLIMTLPVYWWVMMTASRTPHLSCDVTDVEGDKGSLYLLKAEWLVSVVDCPQDQISHCDFTHLFVRQSSSTPCHFILYFMFVPPATIHFIVFMITSFSMKKTTDKGTRPW